MVTSSSDMPLFGELFCFLCKTKKKVTMVWNAWWSTMLHIGALLLSMGGLSGQGSNVLPRLSRGSSFKATPTLDPKSKAVLWRRRIAACTGTPDSDLVGPEATGADILDCNKQIMERLGRIFLNLYFDRIKDVGKEPNIWIAHDASVHAAEDTLVSVAYCWTLGLGCHLPLQQLPHISYINTLECNLMDSVREQMAWKQAERQAAYNMLVALNQQLSALGMSLDDFSARAQGINCRAVELGEVMQ